MSTATTATTQTTAPTPEGWIRAQGFARCVRCEGLTMTTEGGVCATCIHREARAPYVGAIENAREEFRASFADLGDAIEGGEVTPDPEEWEEDVQQASAAFEVAKAAFLGAMQALAVWDACHPRP